LVKILKNKINLLKKVELFSKLTRDEIKIIAEYSEYEKYNKGVEIFPEGSYANELFIIKEGQIIIQHKRPDKPPNIIATFIANECFGERDLFDKIPRMGAAVCETDSVLLRFPKKGVKLEEVLEKYPDISVRLLHKVIAIIAGRIRTVNKMISEKTPWVMDLRKNLFIDKLTGAYNKNFMNEEFPFMLAKLYPNVSLLYLKPDNFKDINDNWGHKSGDDALKLIAMQITSLVQEKGLTVRYQGDEFLAILPDTDFTKANSKAKEIMEKIYNIDLKNITQNDPFNIIFSIGISHFPKKALDVKRLIENARQKMLEVRNSGGNGIKF
jgi:diguanylate cyclase (GGDEF)-like protein